MIMEWTDRQREIIIKTASLIAQYGIQEFTIKNLSKRMELSEAAIYRHFDSKTDILSNVIDYLELVSDKYLFDGSNEQLPPLEKVKFFILSRFRLFNQHPDLAYIMFNGNIFQNDLDLACKMFKLMEKHRSYLENNLMKAKEDSKISINIDKDNLFLILIGPVRLLINQWILSKSAFDLEEKGAILLQKIEELIYNRSGDD